MPGQILLLTATITPPAGVPALVITDAESRRKDYERALAFYAPLIGRCFDSIVFCENSGSDLDSLRRVAEAAGHADRVEFVSFSGVESSAEHGRAYGEFLLIDHAMAHSRILADLGDEIVWKCTGRYVIRNIEKLVADRPREFDIYCNKRNLPGSWADMYLLAWNRRGYETALRGISPQLKASPTEPRSPETLFRLLLDQAGERLKVVPRYRHVPLIDGRRGWDNAQYAASLWDKKVLVREIALRVAPWLWI